MSALDNLDTPTSNNRFDRGFWRTPAGAVSLKMPDGKKKLLGAPSSRAKNHLEETFALDKWKLRQVLLGTVELTSRGELPEMPVDVEANGSKEILNSIADDALDAAGATLAASRGTHAHFLSELNDEGAAWLEHLSAGEDYGLEPEVQAAIVTAWQQLISDNGLDVLAVEQTVVSTETSTAGTLDRIVALTHDLTFTTPTGEVTVPKGTVLVLDVKTSRLRVGRTKAAQPLFWNSFAHQCWCYATGTPVYVDPDDEGNVNHWPWPEPPSTDHALIAHLDVHAALETGRMEAQLVYIDLAAGRRMEEIVRAVKDVRKEQPFSMIGSPSVSIAIPQQPIEVRVERWLRGRIDAIGRRPHAAEMLRRNWPDVRPPATDGYDPADADRIAELLDAVEAESGMPFQPTDPRVEDTDRVAHRATNQSHAGDTSGETTGDNS